MNSDSARMDHGNLHREQTRALRPTHRQAAGFRGQTTHQFQGAASGRGNAVLRVVVMSLSLLAGSMGLSGCTDQASEPQEKASFKRKTTDEIGQFNPAAGNDVVKPDVKVTNPITGPLEAYEPIVQQLATLGIDHAVALFQAEEGRYPSSHEEFMTRIIRQNQIRLPGLPAGLEYQYDLEHHKLVIVKSVAAAPATK
ncbi:MAG: hypothetical protein ACK58L_09155 [Planctomycetota bacterium]